MTLVGLLQKLYKGEEERWRSSYTPKFRPVPEPASGVDRVLAVAWRGAVLRADEVYLGIVAVVGVERRRDKYIIGSVESDGVRDPDLDIFPRLKLKAMELILRYIRARRNRRYQLVVLDELLPPDRWPSAANSRIIRDFETAFRELAEKVPIMGVMRNPRTRTLNLDYEDAVVLGDMPPRSHFFLVRRRKLNLLLHRIFYKPEEDLLFRMDLWQGRQGKLSPGSVIRFFNEEFDGEGLGILSRAREALMGLEDQLMTAVKHVKFRAQPVLYAVR